MKFSSKKIRIRAARAAVALAIGGLSLVVLSAATKPADLRPSLPGKFVWFDLLTNDAKKSEAFYAGLFGWTFETLKDHEPPYRIIRQGGVPIGGLVDLTQRKGDLPESTWLAYVSVPDVDAAAAAFKSKGGKALKEPFDVGKLARAAVLTDPQKALVGVLRAAKGDPEDGALVPGRFFWAEYLAEDAPAAMAFYREVFGYDAKTIDAGVKLEYWALGRGGKNRAGLYQTPWKELHSNWLPYVLVSDAPAAAEKAKSLGGRIALAPKPEVRDGSLAIVVDPTGAALALQKFPFEKK